VKVILLEEVKKLGKKGEVVEVAEGYARNYLLPRKLAVPATSDAINTIKQQQAAEARKAQRQLEEAKMLAAQLAKLTVPFRLRPAKVASSLVQLRPKILLMPWLHNINLKLINARLNLRKL